jgi:hypothetical protein
MRILTISGKTSDLCFTRLKIDGKTIAERDGYVPLDIGLGDDGDYIDLAVDLDTGKIVGWKVPSTAKVVKALK